VTKKAQINDVISSLENGSSITDACIVANIDRGTFYNKLEKDVKFKRKIELARIKYKESHVENIENASNKSWPASAWLLERKYPAEFGQRRAEPDKTITFNILYLRNLRKPNGKAPKQITNGRHKLKG